MSLAIRIRDEDPTPPYEQLRAQIATAIATGELTDGTRLPSVRQLARDLGVAAGTVARAYKELEQAGLVVTGRGAGTRVTGSASAPMADALPALARDFVTRARALGLDDAAIRRAVDAHLA
ncbi:GntR family transcriptional regulator [Luteococcus sp.]|uniref:GntR family transcriptional regulator n=1 Tax=Luteococcus sp. TaxID=1969402 RepID=UPI002649A656|nr:GntR family transcriptional regulator [Luteococcus sp.]